MGQLSSSAVDFEKIMSSSSAPVQAPLPRRASAETLVGLRCAMVSETNASFACPICSRVLRQPQLTDCCGNHFCTACLSRWLQMSSSCPLCRQVGFKSIRDKKIQRTVQDMEVYCHHEGSGCIWRGRLCDVDSHLTSSCPRVLLPCPNDCGELINRESIPSHLAESCTRRSAFCAYCNTEGPLDFITDEHHKVCPKVLLSCPNRCPTGKVLRDELQGHLEECPLQSVQCEFNCFGCEEVLERKGLDSHMSSAQTRHLLLAMKRVSEMGQQLEVWQGNTEQLREELQRSHNEIENLREIVQTLQTQHPSNGVGGAGRISSNLVPPRQTRRLLMEKHLEASAEICQQDHFLPVVLKMDDFSFYSTNREPWYSHPFYSQPLGYKFCLCVYASGICSGQFTHLSAYVHLVAGEFDDSQEWPLQLGLTIELQNQLADKDHWGADCEFRRGGGSQQISQRVARGRARRGAGSATLIRLDKLGLNAAFSNCHYLRNNQLYFNVY